MNKKVVKQKKYDDNEDATIKEVAYYQNSSQIVLLVVLILLFGFTLFCSLVYIGRYYKNINYKNGEIVEINNAKNDAVIVSMGKFSHKITADDITNDKELIYENIASISLSTKKDSTSDGNVFFDVRYNISKNNFNYNNIATNDSDLLVRFAYSYDNENWTYISNAISTTNSTLLPLMGNYFDIAGITNNLKVLTDYNLSVKPGDNKKMYWKSETYVNKNSRNLNKEFEIEFKIEYKGNA